MTYAIGITTCSSTTCDQTPRTHVYFASMTDEALREFCAGASPDNGRTEWRRWDRAMLLAFCRNRWPCGYYVSMAEQLPGRMTL